MRFLALAFVFRFTQETVDGFWAQTRITNLGVAFRTFAEAGAFAVEAMARTKRNGASIAHTRAFVACDKMMVRIARDVKQVLRRVANFALTTAAVFIVITRPPSVDKLVTLCCRIPYRIAHR